LRREASGLRIMRLHIGRWQSSCTLPKVRSVTLIPGFDESCGVSLLQYGYAASLILSIYLSKESIIMTLQPNTRVWRYMSFAKFVSLFQKKQLWLANAKLLGDKWEVMPDTSQINSIINNRPSSMSAEDSLTTMKDVVSKLR